MKLKELLIAISCVALCPNPRPGTLSIAGISLGMEVAEVNRRLGTTDSDWHNQTLVKPRTLQVRQRQGRVITIEGDQVERNGHPWLSSTMPKETLNRLLGAPEKLTEWPITPTITRQWKDYPDNLSWTSLSDGPGHFRLSQPPAKLTQ